MLPHHNIDPATFPSTYRKLKDHKQTSGEQAGYAVSTLNDYMATLDPAGKTKKRKADADIDLTMSDAVSRGPSHPPGAGFDALEGPGMLTPKRVKKAPPGSSTGEGTELGGPPPGSSTAAAIDLEGASPSVGPGASIENGRSSPSIENRRASPRIGPVAGTDEGMGSSSGQAGEASPAAAVNKAVANVGEGGLLASAPATPPALKSERRSEVSSTAHDDYDEEDELQPPEPAPDGFVHPFLLVFCLYGHLSNQPDADITEEPSNGPKGNIVSGRTSPVSNDGETGSEGGSGLALLSRQAVNILAPPDAAMSRREVKEESETQSRLFAADAHREKMIVILEAGQLVQKNMAQSVETISTSLVESAGLDKRKHLMAEHKERIRVCEIIGDAEAVKAAYKDYHRFLTSACTPASTSAPPPYKLPTSLSVNPVEATANYPASLLPV